MRWRKRGKKKRIFISQSFRFKSLDGRRIANGQKCEVQAKGVGQLGTCAQSGGVIGVAGIWAGASLKWI